VLPTIVFAPFAGTSLWLVVSVLMPGSVALLGRSDAYRASTCGATHIERPAKRSAGRCPRQRRTWQMPQYRRWRAALVSNARQRAC
jgi:hypothetical protein